MDEATADTAAWTPAAVTGPTTEPGGPEGRPAPDRNYRDRWQRSRLRVDPALAKQFLGVLEEETFPGIAPLRTTVFDKAKCPHCLGLHSRKCPAVREIEYHPDGRVMRVSYFERWSDTAVLWREDL